MSLSLPVRLAIHLLWKCCGCCRLAGAQRLEGGNARARGSNRRGQSVQLERGAVGYRGRLYLSGWCSYAQARCWTVTGLEVVVALQPKSIMGLEN